MYSRSGNITGRGEGRFVRGGKCIAYENYGSERAHVGESNRSRFRVILSRRVVLFLKSLDRHKTFRVRFRADRLIFPIHNAIRVSRGPVLYRSSDFGRKREIAKKPTARKPSAPESKQTHRCPVSGGMFRRTSRTKIIKIFKKKSYETKNFTIRKVRVERVERFLGVAPSARRSVTEQRRARDSRLSLSPVVLPVRPAARVRISPIRRRDPSRPRSRGTGERVVQH